MSRLLLINVKFCWNLLKYSKEILFDIKSLLDWTAGSSTWSNSDACNSVKVHLAVLCCYPDTVQFRPLTSWVVRGDRRDNSAEILFESFLQKAIENSSGMGRDVHSLMLSIQHFLSWLWHHPSSKVPWGMVFERLSWHMTCLNHAYIHLWTVAKRGSCGPTRKLILPCTQSLVLGLVLQVRDSKKFHQTLRFKILDPFFRVSK